MPAIGNYIGIGKRGGGTSWSSYWATLISATVEEAAPTDVVLTFPTAKTSLGATDFTIAGFTISSASWTGAVLTLVLSTDVVIGDSLTVTFVETGQTAAVTNNVTSAQKWYGVQIDESDSSPDITRIAGTGYDSYHATLPVQSLMKACLLADDGSVNYYLDPADWTKKVSGAASSLDGTDGQVMIEIPDFYYKYELASAGVHNIKISVYAITGFTKSYKRYVSAYEAALNRTTSALASVKNITTTYRGGDNNATLDALDSTLLGKPATDIILTDFRTYARNRGSDRWNALDYGTNKIVCWLFVIEYATLNVQEAYNGTLTVEGYKQGGLGNGVSTVSGAEWSTYHATNPKPFIPCGQSDSLASGSGEITYAIPGWVGVTGTVKIPRYRGIENLFGHLYKFIDGINIYHQAAGGLVKAYVCESAPNNYADETSSGYTFKTDIGLAVAAVDYVKTMLIGAALDWIPVTGGADGATYYCDAYYIDAATNVWRTAYFSGNGSDGANAGLAICVPVAPAASGNGAGVGTRLTYFPSVEISELRDFSGITRYVGNPITPYGTQTWNIHDNDPPYIRLENKIGNTWYGPAQVANSFGVFDSLALFTSTDLVNWAPHATNPILTQEDGEWDEGYLLHPSVIQIGTTWYMYYSAVNAAGKHQIGVATSPDFVTWTKHPSNPIYSTAGNASTPCVIKIGSVYFLYYNNNTAVANTNLLCYATSPDGITWTYGGVCFTTTGYLLNYGVIDPWVIQRSDGYYEMVFSRVTWLPAITQDLGYAISKDGINWTVNQAPILAVTGAGWESAMLGDPVLLEKADGTTYLYYAGIQEVTAGNFWGEGGLAIV